MNKISLYEKEYPIRVSMGAMRRYKRETGQDMNLMGGDIDLMLVFMYCCVAGACNADDVPFDLDIDKFADGMSLEDFNRYAQTLSLEAEGSKKKETVTGEARSE